MMDFKAMTTPIASNMKLLSDDSSETVDAMTYCHLMYLTYMRLDSCFVVKTLRHVHLIAAKHILRYLRGTIYYGLKYEANQKINLKGNVDSDWAGISIDRKSTSGCCFGMGSCVISRFSMK